jgi:hypothetical protein
MINDNGSNKGKVKIDNILFVLLLMFMVNLKNYLSYLFLVNVNCK